MSWHVYLAQCADGTFYCGITKDLARRMDQHNGLRPGGARYTSGRRPVELLHSMACEDKSQALKAEIRIKALPREEKALFFKGLAQS